MEELTDAEKIAIISILETAANQVDAAFVRGSLSGKNHSNRIRSLIAKLKRMVGQKNESYPY